VQGISCTWIGTTGNWGDKDSWDCKQTPGPEDDAYLPGGTLSVNESLRVKSFTQSGGNLVGAGNLTADTITWSAGWMKGTGTTTALKEAKFLGSNYLTLDGRTLNNAGTATWNRTGSGFLNFQVTGSVFNNKSGATFTVQSSGPDITKGNGAFNNAGTLNLNTGKFTIDTFTQTSGGVTNMPIGGRTAFTDFTRFVTTQASLDGTLNITFTGGFTPEVGDSFTLLTFSTRTGDYSTVNIPPVGDIIWIRYYTVNSMVLWAAKYRSFIPVAIR
jgi:hypothetical protein